MNRSGHIGTLLLVLGALVLVGVALFNMVNFSGDVSKIREELHLLSNEFIAVHEYNLLNIEMLVSKSIVSSKNSMDFEDAFNVSLKSLAGLERVAGLNTNVYAKLALGNYSLNFDGVNYTLVINDIFEQTNVKNNEGRYIYNLHVVFSKASVISMGVF